MKNQLLKPQIAIAVITTVILLPIALAQEAGAPVYQAGDTVYVTGSSLALRRGPSPDTERIHYIPKGTALTVLSDTEAPVPFEIEGLKGHWLRVKHGYHKGYVFDGFVSAKEPSLEDRIDWTIVPGERVGPITYTTTYQDLVEFFGKENVKDTVVLLEEGMSEPGTALFPDTKNEIHILWKEYHEKPVAVILKRKGSRWKTMKGIGVGTTLDELVRLNGKPVSFDGLEKCYAGEVYAWHGGALESSHAPGKDIDVFLGPNEPFDWEDARAITKEGPPTSARLEATRLNLTVREMVVVLNPPEADLPDTPAYPAALAQRAPLRAGIEQYVIASKLNVRQTPEPSAAVIYRMPYGSKVQVAQQAGERVPLVAEGIYGHWIPLTIQGKAGFAFDAYLTPYPVPRAGTEGLWDYAEASLTPDGEEQRTTTGDTRNGSETVIQRYKEGVMLEHKSAWQAGRTSHTTSLTLPGLSIEQAYILMKRADRRFKDVPFKVSPQGRFSATVNGLTMTIEPQLTGVRITESGSK